MRVLQNIRMCTPNVIEHDCRVFLVGGIVVNFSNMALALGSWELVLGIRGVYGSGRVEFVPDSESTRISRAG